MKLIDATVLALAGFSYSVPLPANLDLGPHPSLFKPLYEPPGGSCLSSIISGCVAMMDWSSGENEAFTSISIG